MAEMTEKQVLDIIREFISEVSDDVHPDAVVPEATFEILDLDSLSVLEIMVSCEERFGIQLLEGTAPEIATVGDAVQYLTGRMAAATAPGGTA